MKQSICLLLAALTALGLSACGEKVSAPTVETASSAITPTEAKPLPTLPQETAATEETEPVQSSEPAESTFVDLTVLSSTMVYAEVFAMMSSPEDYVGKTVKMQGIFSRGQLYAADGSLSDGGMVFACIVQDATACCAQGIPFDLAGDYEYPQDYPELGDTITVIGTFEIHEQEGMQFCRLRDAEFVQ